MVAGKCMCAPAQLWVTERVGRCGALKRSRAGTAPRQAVVTTRRPEAPPVHGGASTARSVRWASARPCTAHA